MLRKCAITGGQRRKFGRRTARRLLFAARRTGLAGVRLTADLGKRGRNGFALLRIGSALSRATVSCLIQTPPRRWRRAGTGRRKMPEPARTLFVRGRGRARVRSG